jgi:hypothetical protein
MKTKSAKTALSRATVIGALVLMALAAAPVPAQVCGPDQDGRLANAVYRDTTIVWEPVVEYERMILTIAGPCEDIIRVFRRGDPIFFDIREIERVQDGAYTWELRREAAIDASTKKELARSRALGDDSIWWNLWQSGAIPKGPYVESAPFLVVDGVIVPPGQQEEKSGQLAKAESPARAVTSAALAQLSSMPGASKGPRPSTAADQVIPDDLIVQGSQCVGFDCVNNENFSFDTIRLKENNLRIHFDDTSTTAGYPANDWRLIANDSASGGSSKFSIEDSTGAKTPFTVEAGATTNSIFIDSTGRVGFRTSTPVLDLHVNTSNTPALRLEQNNSGGFTAQTWDVAGNEANFFVRDVTGGSRLPFRIRPGAPTSSLDISADGDIGIGTASPSNKLHVTSSGSGSQDGKVLISNTSGTNAARELLEARNNGQVLIIMEDTSVTPRWAFATQGNNWVVDNQSVVGTELILSDTGNLTITGVYSPSDRSLKKDIVPVRRDVLEKLAAVPISTWSYKTDDVRHIGPMAQDFSAAFGLGIDDKHVSPMDMAGVSMAAVQALNEVVQEKDEEISGLKSRIEALEKLVHNLTQAKSEQ